MFWVSRFFRLEVLIYCDCAGGKDQKLNKPAFYPITVVDYNLF